MRAENEGRPNEADAGRRRDNEADAGRRRQATTADYYRILNISRDAEPPEVQRAYRSLARTHHPDVNTGAIGSISMSMVNEAYQCLSDASKRRRYDQFLKVREPLQLQRAALEIAETMIERAGWRRTTLGESCVVLERGSRRVATHSITVLGRWELDGWTRSAMGLLRRDLVECAVVIAYRIVDVEEIESRIVDLGQPLSAIDLVESRAFGMEFSDDAYEELFRPLLIG